MQLFGARSLPHMQRPLPARLISRAPNRHSTHLDKLELPLFKSPHLIRILKPLQNHFVHDSSSPSHSAHPCESGCPISRVFCEKWGFSFNNRLQQYRPKPRPESCIF